jgi:hypothetical protein
VSPGGGIVLAAALLLSPSCGAAARDGEIACQRRLVAATLTVPRPSSGEPALATAFATMSRDFEQMPLDGCSGDQRGRAAIMARVTRELSTIATRTGDLRRQMDQVPELRRNEAFMELAARLEQFEHRRQAMRQDLDAMLRSAAE